MDSIYLGLFKVFRFFIRSFPSFIVESFLNLLVVIVYKIDKKHRHVAKVNLDLAFENKKSEEEKALIIKACYKNIVYSLADFVRNQGANKDEILEKVTFKNEHYFQEVLDAGRKVILITAHYGNWELLSLSVAARFTPLSVVGRDLDSSVMNDILTANREQFDVELLSKTGAMKGMMKALKSNRAVGILVDQNTTDDEGLLIDFFDKKARHTPSAAFLSRKFDALLVPAFIRTNDHKEYEVEFYEPFPTTNSENKDQDILESVNKQAHITQKAIEEKPDEWFWLHQRWKNQYEELYK